MKKQFKIEKRGRKYFTALLGRYRAKLVINEASKELEPGQTVEMEVNDISKHTSYGSTLIFEPITNAHREDAAAAAKRREAEKWLSYAEKDVQSGYSRSNAIEQAMHLCPPVPEFAERLAVLKTAVAKNKEAASINKYGREVAAKPKRVLFAEVAAPELNTPVRLYGQVIVFESRGGDFRITDEHPSIHGAHLLGHEGDWGRYYYYRPATEDEIAELEAKEATARNERQRKARVEEIAREIRLQGEQLDGPQQPEGERLHDSQDIHGGGDWFVVGSDWIWYVRNNGMDGDNWAANNVITGGAGALGWRVPFDAALADELKNLERQ